MPMYLAPKRITESHLGTDTLHLIALHPVAVADLRREDLYNTPIRDFDAPFQSVWLRKEEAERFADEFLRPPEKPYWLHALKCSQPVVLSMSIEETKALLARIHPRAGLIIEDSTDNGPWICDDSDDEGEGRIALP